MGLGLSKDFIIFFIIALFVAYGFEDWMAGAWLFGIYAIIKIIYKFLTN